MTAAMKFKNHLGNFVKYTNFNITCYRSHLTWCFRMSLHFRFRCCWHQQQHKHLSKVEGPSLHIEATMDQQPLWLNEFRIENCEIWHGGVQDNPKLIWFFHWLYYGVFPTGCCRETYQTCKTKTIKASSKGISSSKRELRRSYEKITQNFEYAWNCTIFDLMA